MHINEHLSEYDNLSIQLFSALAENAIDNISSSAGKMLDVACLFFDKDVSATLLDFQKLYIENSHLDHHKDSANQQADNILEAAMNANGEDPLIPEFDHHPEIEKLANIQKELEALIQQDEHIKQRMIPVMQCMQYEDMVANRMKRLLKCWEYMVSILNSRQDRNITSTLSTFDSFLASEDEHKQFYNIVLHSPNHHLNIADIKHDISGVNLLLERLLAFSNASLEDCINQTQQAFDELINLLSLVTGESEDVSYLFTNKEETLNDIQNIIAKNKASGHIHARKMIEEIAATREKHSQEASELIQSFMIALQSQDIIRQNIENIGRLHDAWGAYRSTIKQQNRFDSNTRKEFGSELVRKMTSHTEREIIDQYIPGALTNNENSADDDVFF